MSSAQVVGKVKWLLGCEKIGHAGTLDPGASGLLVCLLGRATRLAAHAEEGRKIYSGTVALGVTTTTDDLAGEVLTRAEVRVREEQLEAVLPRLRGEILQLPPQVSALKVGGERAYALVRRGEEVALKPRPVTIYSLTLSNFQGDTFDFRCECSKGTYIRSLARDIGAALGCGGALKSLRREASWPFSVAQGTRLDGELTTAILPWFDLFPDTPRIELPLPGALGVWNGDLRALARIPEPRVGQERALYAAQGGQPAGLLRWDGTGWRIGVNVSVPGKHDRGSETEGE
jgi:tRNA pseudouridine55 synthase